MHSDTSTPLWERSITTGSGFHLVGGKEPHLLLKVYQRFRGGSLVLQRHPLNAVDYALLCMLVCSIGSKPVRGRVLVGQRRHAGDVGGIMVLPSSPIMLSAASPASTSSPKVRSPMLQGPANRADSWNAVAQAGTLSPKQRDLRTQAHPDVPWIASDSQ